LFLTEAAKNAARYDPKLRPFYERIGSRKGNHKAIIAVARKRSGKERLKSWRSSQSDNLHA
jgi:hypothetical protein